MVAASDDEGTGCATVVVHIAAARQRTAAIWVRLDRREWRRDEGDEDDDEDDDDRRRDSGRRGPDE